MRECQAARYEGEKQFPSAAQPVSVTTDLSLVTWCTVLTSNDKTWNGNENQEALTRHKSLIGILSSCTATQILFLSTSGTLARPVLSSSLACFSTADGLLCQLPTKLSSLDGHTCSIWGAHKKYYV